MILNIFSYPTLVGERPELNLHFSGRKVNIKMVWDNKAESFYEQTLIVLDVSPVDSSLSESTNSSTRNSREYLNNEASLKL